MSGYEKILFDIDDTLIDFRHSEAISLRACHERFFRACANYEDFFADYSRFNHNLWKQVEEGEFSSAEVGEERFKQLTAYYGSVFSPEIPHFFEGELIKNACWMEGAEVLLDEIKTKNIPIGFVTNSLAHVARGKYFILELDRYSDVLVISEEIGCAKPSPQIFHHALELLEAEPAQSLMVGDSLSSDGEGARRAGIPFCWFNPRKAPHPADWKPELIIHHFSELDIG